MQGNKKEIIIDLLKKYKLKGTTVAAIVSILCLLVPIQMASQTWNDHDRSNRYTCRDFGQNYLMSLQAKNNPIIFTNGDNDTFPLWYNQDVEGVRTDARVCNLSYLQTDWYIDQMKRPAYNSPSVPISWPRLDYCAGTNEYVEVHPEAKKTVLDFYKQNPAQAKATYGDNPFELKNVLKYWVRSKNADMHIIPTDTVYVTIDKNAVRRSSMMMASDTIPDRMVISLKGKNALYKGDLMMLEMIAQCNWTRPLYVALTVGQENYMNLGDNFIQEGLVNRITPFTTNANGAKNFDTEKVYNNLMHRFKFGGINRKGIYIDETVMRMCFTHRRLFTQLALGLINEKKFAKAAQVLAYCDKMIPSYNVPVDYQSGSIEEAKAYATLGNKAKSKALFNALWTKSQQYLNWYTSLNGSRFEQAQQDCLLHFYIMQQIVQYGQHVDKGWAAQKQNNLSMLLSRYQAKGGQLPKQQ